MYYTQWPSVFPDQLKKICKETELRLTSKGKKLLGVKASVWSAMALHHALLPYHDYVGVCVCVCVTSHLVHISLGGPFFAEALLLHGFGIVDLLGLLQSLRGGLDVLYGLQSGRNLLLCLATHNNTHVLSSNSANSRLNNKCKCYPLFR